ncbi:carbon storage regulator [Alienimonas sp. DA493]|uniref:carbon storage regulator n=1 Tax=Alienimonas sp. DA493 TaxID=3373605 RepID=UPI0037552A13
MLVLARKVGQTVRLPNQDVTVHVVAVSGQTVRLGVEAPSDVAIVRGELEETRTPPASPAVPAAEPSRDLAELRVALDRLTDRVSATERAIAACGDGAAALSELRSELKRAGRLLDRVSGRDGTPSLAC